MIGGEEKKEKDLESQTCTQSHTLKQRDWERGERENWRDSENSNKKVTRLMQ